MAVYKGVRSLASTDPVLDALWWSGACLVAPFPGATEAIRTCAASGVGLVAQFDVDSELWKSGVGLWHRRQHGLFEGDALVGATWR